MTDEKLCSIENCFSKSFRRGWCSGHYARWRRHGDPTLGRTPVGEPHAFLEKAILMETDDCIEWPYGKTTFGYGTVYIEGMKCRAHRVVLERTCGPAPTDRHLAIHAPGICHNPSCVNKRHLRWGTYSENNSDKLIDGTDARGENHGNSTLNADQVLSIRDDIRDLSKIAQEYQIHKETVRKIKLGVRWGWL